MFFIIGFVVLVASVLGGYLPHGKAEVLWQPFEFIIIIGSAIGGYIIGNPKDVLFKTGKAFTQVFKGTPHNRQHYVELLSLLYTLFKIAKQKGNLGLEEHIEKPENSPVFKKFPTVIANHHAVVFLCDYIRLLTMGSENPHELGDLIDEEIDTHHHELERVSGAITRMGDGLPAFGIVAAVLGVITTMGSILEPPEVLGALIGAALVGTFSGILLAYGLVAPIGAVLTSYAEDETKYFQCIKAGLIAHVQDYAPGVSVEFARKVLFSNERPSFAELEKAVQAAPA